MLETEVRQVTRSKFKKIKLKSKIGKKQGAEIQRRNTTGTQDKEHKDRTDQTNSQR